MGTLETATTRDESSGESAVEARPLEMPKSDAKDETPSKDQRDFSEHTVDIDDDYWLIHEHDSIVFFAWNVHSWAP